MTVWFRRENWNCRISPGEAEISEGVKASDLLRVGEPTTMVIIFEKGDRAEGGVGDGVEAAAAVEEASVLLVDSEGWSFPFPASILSAVSGAPPGMNVSKIISGLRKSVSEGSDREERNLLSGIRLAKGKCQRPAANAAMRYNLERNIWDGVTTALQENSFRSQGTTR